MTMNKFENDVAMICEVIDNVDVELLIPTIATIMDIIEEKCPDMDVEKAVLEMLEIRREMKPLIDIAIKGGI